MTMPPREVIMLWGLEWPVAAVLIETGIRALMVVGGATIAGRALRDQSASIRRQIWIGAMTVVLVVGLVGAVSAFRTALYPPLIWESLGTTSVASSFPNPLQFLLWIWLVPTMFLLLRLAVTQYQLQHLLRECEPLTRVTWSADARRIGAQQGLRKTVPLLVSQQLSSPVTVGVFRPRIVLPQSFVAASAGLREAVLWHELSHVSRRDVAGRWLAAITCAVHWFNPIVWLAARNLRRECECASDEAVVNSGVARSSYARHLLSLAEATAPQPASLVTLGLGASELRLRIEALAEQRTHREFGASMRIALAAAGIAMLLTALQLQFPQPQMMFQADSVSEPEQSIPDRK
jgi:beta-lactamase regulating signal transducer with metallopeptidase domain